MQSVNLMRLALRLASKHTPNRAGPTTAVSNERNQNHAEEKRYVVQHD